MTFSWHLCFWNTFWIQGHRDAFLTPFYLREILSVCWVNCFQKREREMRCSIIWRGAVQLFLFLASMFSFLPLGVAFLREWETHSLSEATGKPGRTLSPKAWAGPAKPSLFFLEGSMLIISTLSFPLTFLPSAWEGVLSSEILDALMAYWHWQAWSPGGQLSFWGWFHLNRELESNTQVFKKMILKIPESYSCCNLQEEQKLKDFTEDHKLNGP